VDIEGRALYERDWAGGAVRQRVFDERVSLALRGAGNEMILGLQGGVARYDLETGHLSRITALGINWDNIRCNDGRADGSGRLWIGTMPMEGHAGQGSLYCVEPGGSYSVQQAGVAISNGMAWSADQRFFYYTDSATREIWQYHFSEGSISGRRTVITIPPHLGLPDGMAIDAEGMLWIALYGGSGVGRWNPATGSMMDFISLPVPNATSCAFAGEALDQLIITTAAGNGGGHLYIAEPGVKGMPLHVCGL
jgi:sugar lactone lactonase YvrE